MTGKRDGRAVSADQDRLDAIAASEVFLDAPDVLVDDVQDVLVDVGDGTLIQAILAIGGDPAGMTSSELYEVASAILSSAPRAVTETFRAHLGAHGRFA